MKKRILLFIFLCIITSLFYTVADATSNISAGSITGLQSAHPYGNNLEYYYNIRCFQNNENITKLIVYFSEETEVEKDKDFISIYNADKSLIKIFSLFLKKVLTKQK